MYNLSQEDKNGKETGSKQRERQKGELKEEEGRMEACYIFNCFELKHSLQEAGGRLIKPKKEMN